MTPKKTVLASLCATYSHTPLALYALKAYCVEFEDYIHIESFTINQPDDFILRRIYAHKPEILGFSCYIWNIEKTVRIAIAIRLLLPDVFIVFGGPEMSAEYEPYLKSGIADKVIQGEGEKAWLEFLGGKPLDDTFPFPYKNFDGLEHKALYYEASRGCPFSCAYCLSSGTKLWLKPLETVLNELKIFIIANVMRVKFIDRTFNAREEFAMAIWRFLMENDNGITRFHFEIAADLLSDDALALLNKARVGLFQFEIGVQSTNEVTLALINRKTDLPRLFTKVQKMQRYNNIHLHLDLIAGLPGDSLVSFRDSFNQVYALRPHHLQLGFLKLLKGTDLRENAQKLGLVYNPHPPYEILSTPHIFYDDLLLLKSVAEMVELFYNAGKFTHTIIYLLQATNITPFDFYAALADFWHREGLADRPHGKISLYKIFYEFAEKYIDNAVILKNFLRFDLLANENEKSVPGWLMTHRHRDVFQIDILSWLNGDIYISTREHKLIFIYPTPGRQNPLTLRERVKEG